MIRVATYNVQNLFSRARPLDLEGWDQGRPILNEVQELNDLLARERYDTAAKERIAAILQGNEDRKPSERQFEVVEAKGSLFKRSRGRIVVDADGRDDWLGWVELKRAVIPHRAIENTGRVIAEVAADVLLMVEVEDRIAMQRFDEHVLQPREAGFAHNLLVDGNDERGIDVGIMSRFPIRQVRSHIDDGAPDRIFSRDCPEFEIELPGGKSLWVLGNHFKSRGFGAKADNDRRRERQASRVAEIYALARQRGDLVLIAGDLNDHWDSEPLAPLRGADLVNAFDLPGFTDDTRWTHKSDSDEEIDYLLLSPALAEATSTVGRHVKGIWAPRKGDPFDTVTSDADQASDHAAVWADIEV